VVARRLLESASRYSLGATVLNCHVQIKPLPKVSGRALHVVRKSSWGAIMTRFLIVLIAAYFLTSCSAEASWNDKAISFCEKYKAYGKVNGELFCSSSGKFQVESCPEDSGDNLRRGFDARALCLKAVKDCFKWRKHKVCLSGVVYESHGNKWTMRNVVDDIAGTEGFAPADVTAAYGGDYSGKYLWRNK
jgi:hypothetical protein